MKKMKSILALVLAMILCLGMSVTSFADETPTLAKEVYITKDLNIAKGTTTPNVTFTFKFEADTNASQGLQGYAGEIPAIADKTVTYSDAITDVGDDEVITLTTGDILAGLTFPHAGVYAYTVREAQTGFTDTATEKMTYDSKEYTLRIWVVNGTEGTVIKGATVSTTTGKVTTTTNGKDTVTEGTDESKAANDNGFRFSNNYTKTSGTNGDSITVSKAVVGEYADKSEDFTFTLNVTKASTDKSAETTYSYVITRDSDHANDNTDALTGTGTYGTDLTFTLDADEKLVVKNLVAGASYTVKETGVADYTASVVLDGTETKGEKGSDLQVTAEFVDEKGSTAAFTNTNDGSEVPPTGIIINNLPYVMLILVAVLGFSFFFVSRRRRY